MPRSRRHLYVAVESADGDPVALVHAAGDPGANYDTLCGLSTSDDLYVTVDLPPGAKIDCCDCRRVYDLAHQFRPSDFE